MKEKDVGHHAADETDRREAIDQTDGSRLRRAFLVATAAAAAGAVLPGCGRGEESPSEKPGSGEKGTPGDQNAAAKPPPPKARGSAKKADVKGLPRWAMVVDLRRCVGCRGCTIACKAEFDIPLGKFSCVVRQEEVGKYPNARKAFLPTLCNHCKGYGDSGPPCVKECPQSAIERAHYTASDGSKHRYRIGATYVRPDGAVLIDVQHCTGCGKCIDACPYGVRWWHPGVKAPLDKAKQAVGKCTFCMHRVDKGLLPACVNVCEGKARIFGNLNDPTDPVSKLVKEFGLDKKLATCTLLPNEKTQPHVFYIDPDGDIKGVYKKGQEYKDEVY